MFDAIANEVERYLSGEITLQALREWEVANFPHIVASRDKAADMLSVAIAAGGTFLDEGLEDTTDFDARLREELAKARALAA